MRMSFAILFKETANKNGVPKSILKKTNHSNTRKKIYKTSDTNLENIVFGQGLNVPTTNSECQMFSENEEKEVSKNKRVTMKLAPEIFCREPKQKKASRFTRKTMEE